MWSSVTTFLTNNTVVRQMYDNGSIQRSNMRTYELVLKSAKNTHLWSLWTISLTNNIVARWMYDNGSIWRSNIRTYELALKSAKIHICDLHTQYPLPIILLGVKCTRKVAFNALKSGYMDWCQNQLNNSLAIFTHNNSCQQYCLALNVRKW